nr:RecName: Full=Uncharacterized protein IMPP6 [Nautilus macromphalus]
SFSESLAAAR